MCLEVGEYETAEFFKEHDPDEEITVWKIYEVAGQKIIPPFFQRNKSISPGWIKSNRKTVSCPKRPRWDGTYPIVARGIHVFLTREAARRGLRNWWWSGEGQIFKCTARVSDLIAVGNYHDENEAAFMKIHLSKAEFERGKKGRN